MALLDAVNSPADLKKLSYAQLRVLSREICSFLVKHVAKTGGHLGPNLGVVELTIALHRVFHSPSDTILFDVGHQTYVHKLLTGRKNFDHLRQRGGLSGYASRSESTHDVIENSHATTALSWADGIARAGELNERNGCVVAVIGDGALTGGMAWEALNNIAEAPQRPLIIVVNDNGRSYAPTVGGIVRRIPAVRKLDTLRVDRRYEKLLSWGKRTLRKAGIPGEFAYDALHGLKKGVKDVLFDAGIFDALQIKYLGPVDGHDIQQLEEAFEMAKNYGGCVVVHAITYKGRGYKPAEENTIDHLHAIGRIHPETGLPIAPERFAWTSVVAQELVELARKNPKLVAITAAMLRPVGLGPMAEEFPDRVFDVGIAEQHAVTMAAGLSYAGMHPVVALYATFMNRAFDQLLMDVALHEESVTIALDRAGITGADGPSHNGVWDLALATEIPGLRVAVPRDEPRLRALLAEAVAAHGPTMVRYPKGALPDPLPSLRRESGCAVLFEHIHADEKPIVLIGLGPMAHTMVDVARAHPDMSIMVLDPEWALPVPCGLIDMVSQAAGVITLEDGTIHGGFGAELAMQLSERGCSVPIMVRGVVKQFLQAGSREEILSDQGMDAASIGADIRQLYERIQAH